MSDTTDSRPVSRSPRTGIGSIKAKRNPYRCPDRSASPGDPIPIVHDVPLPNGTLAMQVAVVRLANMPGWSKVETRSGTGCGLSPDDFDADETHQPREVMRAALRIALQLPAGDNSPLTASIYGAMPLPDRLADFSARAMVNALAQSSADCLHRLQPRTTGGSEHGNPNSSESGPRQPQ